MKSSVDVLAVPVAAEVKILLACIAVMTDEANSAAPERPYSAADIMRAALADPYGETACYLRNGFDAGRKWYCDFERCPELLEVFPGHAALARVKGGAA